MWAPRQHFAISCRFLLPEASIFFNQNPHYTAADMREGTSKAKPQGSSQSRQINDAIINNVSKSQLGPKKIRVEDLSQNDVIVA